MSTKSKIKSKIKRKSNNEIKNDFKIFFNLTSVATVFATKSKVVSIGSVMLLWGTPIGNFNKILMTDFPAKFVSVSHSRD